jgi:hypothetical protein
MRKIRPLEESRSVIPQMTFLQSQVRKASMSAEVQHRPRILEPFVKSVRGFKHFDRVDPRSNRPNRLSV